MNNKENLINLILENFKDRAGNGVVTKNYGDSTEYEDFHPAIDVAGSKGTDVRSPLDGIVRKIVKNKQNGDNGFGNIVLIEDSEGNKAQVAHLQDVSVKRGDYVSKGSSKVGSMGNSGSAYSPSGQGDGTHLDLRIRNNKNKLIDPTKYIKYV
jgi:murein DD-endopeptidase MepM/ murein hydrolase activator NlpD